MTDILIDARRGAGSSLEILYGTVTWKPTLTHSRGTSIVLPAPTTYDLVDGQVVATNVQPTPAPVGGQVEWAYEVTFKDRHGKTFSFLVGVPDSTTQVNFISLPRYFETKPPLFGQGPKGDPGESATVAVGTVSGGTTAQVNNSGTNTDAVLNFVLPQGPQGSKGDGVNYISATTAEVLPTVYPNGLSYFFIGSNTGTGWPISFASVWTYKTQSAARTSQRIISHNGEGTWQRIGTTGSVWGAFERLATTAVATTTANGLMSSADKSKLDTVGVLTFNTKTPSDAPSTYPEGTTVGLMAVSGGWPEIEGNVSGSVIVRTDRPKGYNSATQWVSGHKTSDDSLNPSASVMYREGATTGTWGEWQSLATQSVARRISGVINATDYPTVQQAIDEAFTSKKPLLVDTDVVATSVDYKIFQLQTVGKGSITVGGNKFWANPQHQGIQTNRLYINPTTGDDNNSGIDPNAPIKTFTRLNVYMSMLREKLLDGFWEIIIKAGTHYLTSGWIQGGLRTKWPLIISGEGNKATVLDGTNDTSGKAFLFKHHQTVTTIKNLRIQNYVGGSENDGYDTSAAIICQGPGQVRVEDVAIKDCTTGISLGYAISGSVYRCTIDGNESRSTNTTISTGVSVIYGASVTVGGSGGNGNTISRCVTGVHVSRNSVAHVDFNTFEDNYYGLQSSHNARVAIIDGNFYRNKTGIQLSGGAELTYSTAQYGVGANANTDYNLRIGGSARLSSYTGASTSAVEYRINSSQYPTPIITPNNMNRNVIETFPSDARIPANTLLGAGKKIRVILRGRAESSTGLRRFQLSKNTLDGQNHQIISTLTPGAGLTGAFTLEFVAETTNLPGQFVWSSSVIGASYSLQNSGTLSNLDITHDWRFRIYQENLGSGDDTINISHTELFVTG